MWMTGDTLGSGFEVPMKIWSCMIPAPDDRFLGCTYDLFGSRYDDYISAGFWVFE